VAGERTLGPATEARIREAFSCAAVITAGAAAELLGVDVRTLRALTDDSAIRALRVGKTRRYTEADIRQYLTEGPDIAARPARPSRSPSPTQRRQIVPFTSLMERRRGPGKRPQRPAGVGEQET